MRAARVVWCLSVTLDFTSQVFHKGIRCFKPSLAKNDTNLQRIVSDTGIIVVSNHPTDKNGGTDSRRTCRDDYARPFVK